MRILFPTAWYPNRKVAGDGVFIQKHARAVAQLNDVAVLMVQTDVAVRGLHVDIVASEPQPPQTAGAEGSALREVLVYVPKTRFEVPLLTGLIRLFWLMIGYIRGYRYIKRHYWQGQRPEVCHVNVLTRAAGLPWLLRRLHRIPYIITEHWTRYARPDAYPESRMQLWMGRLFVRDASYVCPVSHNLEQSMKQWGLHNRRYTRIGNVVDTDLFALGSPAPHQSATPVAQPTAAPVRFVHVSWMRDPAKNISGILRTLSRLQQTHPGTFHVDFIGEGNDKEQLIHLAQQLGLTTGPAPCVTFQPALTGAALAEALRSHDAMVMFSNHENQPVSILEALSCGLPVIATSIAAIPSMLGQKRGVTVEPRNEEQLLQVLTDFVTILSPKDPATRLDPVLAQQRHQYVVSHHSPAVIARQFDVLYHAASTVPTS